MRVVALGGGVLDVLDGDVLVEVDERLAALLGVTRLGGRAGDGSGRRAARPPAREARRAPAASSPSAAAASRARQRARQLRRVRTLVAGDRAGRVDGWPAARRRRTGRSAWSKRARAPDCSSSDVAGAAPPETASRSHSIRSSVPATALPAVVDPGEHDALDALAPERPDDRGALQDAQAELLRAARSARWARGAGRRPPRPGSRRRAAPARRRARRRRRSPPRPAARPAGRTARRCRRAPPASMTPGRSLSAKTSGCSIVPVAATMRARARIWCSVLSCQTGTRPSKKPSAGARLRISTPASRRRSRQLAGAFGPALGQQPPARLRCPRRTARRRRPPRRRAARRPGRRRRRRPPARRSGDGGTRCATRARPGAWAACPGRRRGAGPSRRPATSGAGG